MPFHHSQVKLGKKEAVHDDRTLLFGNYLKSEALPYIPQAYYQSAGLPKVPLYRNGDLGDCTCCAPAHQEGIWTFKSTGKELILPDSEIVSVYSKVGGYVIGDPSTDNGSDMLTVEKLWKSSGLYGSDDLVAFAALEPGNHTHVMASVFLFGGVSLGIQLPVTAQTQSKANGLWSLVPGYQSNPNSKVGSWGGHNALITGYSQQSVCIETWNFFLYATWGWLDYYADEAFSNISRQWINAKGLSPNHFDLTQLQEDLTLIT